MIRNHEHKVVLMVRVQKLFKSLIVIDMYNKLKIERFYECKLQLLTCKKDMIEIIQILFFVSTQNLLNHTKHTLSHRTTKPYVKQMCLNDKTIANKIFSQGKQIHNTTPRSTEFKKHVDTDNPGIPKNAFNIYIMIAFFSTLVWLSNGKKKHVV